MKMCVNLDKTSNDSFDFTLNVILSLEISPPKYVKLLLFCDENDEVIYMLLY